MKSAKHGFASMKQAKKQATPKVAFVFLCLLTSKYPAEQDEECGIKSFQGMGAAEKTDHVEM